MSYQPNESITDAFYHGTTGKVDGDFTKRLYLNGVADAATVTVTEIANGYYSVAFTPDAEGVWALALEEGSLKWEESYNVIDAADYKATGFSVPNEYDAVIAALQADLDNPDQYKADVSGLSTHSALDVVTTMQAVADDFKADVSGLAPAGEYDAELAAIQADLDNPSQYKADVSNLDVAVSSRSSHSAADVITAFLASAAYTAIVKIRKFVSNKLELDNTANTYTVYEDDGTTPAYTGTQTTTERTPD